MPCKCLIDLKKNYVCYVTNFHSTTKYVMIVLNKLSSTGVLSVYYNLSCKVAANWTAFEFKWH